MQITQCRAIDAGQCQECGAGMRGPVSVYLLEPMRPYDTMRGLRLCLNCLKRLRLAIGDTLGISRALADERGGDAATPVATFVPENKRNVSD